MKRQVNFVLTHDDMAVMQDEKQGKTSSGFQLFIKKALSFFSTKNKKQQNTISDDRIDVNMTMSWDEKNLSIKIGKVKGSYPWQLFYGFHEFPHFMALYISETKFHILPKRALSQAQLQDLRPILSSNMRQIEMN